MPSSPSRVTQEELDKVMHALGELLGVLGWVVQKPDEDVDEGLLIGTPEFITAWTETLKKRKEDLS